MMRRLLLDRSAASAAEFAMVLPLFLILLLGLLDGGRYLWEINKAEKATQYGARFATVATPAASGMAGYSFVGVTWGGVTLTQGDVIPSGGFEVQCTSTSCACVSCPSGMTVALAGGTPSPFVAIANRMRRIKRDITDAQVRVSYTGSGLGYAGDPNGMDISPLVTVELTGATFHPVTGMIFGGLDVPLPTFRTTLTAEDLAGTTSN